MTKATVEKKEAPGPGRIKRRPGNAGVVGGVMIRLNHNVEAALRLVHTSTGKTLSGIVEDALVKDEQIKNAMAGLPLTEVPNHIRSAAEEIAKYANKDVDEILKKLLK